MTKCEKLSFEQKKDVASKIQSAAEPMATKIIDLIVTNRAGLIPESEIKKEELVIDIDGLDDRTLYQLYQLLDCAPAPSPPVKNTKSGATTRKRASLAPEILQMASNENRPSKNTRKKKNKRLRSQSVFTATSTGSSTRQDDLEAAKAAAIKLLEHSSDLPLLAHHPTGILNQLAIGSDPKPHPPKRARFENHVPPLLEDQPARIEATSSDSLQIISHPPHPKDSSHPPPNQSTTSSLLPPAPCIQSILRPPPPKSPPSHNLDAPACFQVTREEVFSDTAIVDAFQAALNEFNFCRTLEKEQTGASGGQGSFEPVILPQSLADQRRVSALYYGQPPCNPTSKSKKPRSDSIFLPPLIAPSNPVIEAKSKEAEKRIARRSRTRRASTSSRSDLDMDDYWDMMGCPSDQESAGVGNDHQEDDEEEEQQPEDEELEPAQRPEDEELEQAEMKKGVVIEDQRVVIEDQRSCSDMCSSTDSNASNGPACAATRTMTADARGQVSVCAGSGAVQGGPPGPATIGAGILTDSQKVLLSNALNAQYWAGYHTAVFNHSVGLELQSLPLLVPHVSSENSPPFALLSAPDPATLPSKSHSK